MAKLCNVATNKKLSLLLVSKGSGKKPRPIMIMQLKRKHRKQDYDYTIQFPPITLSHCMYAIFYYEQYYVTFHITNLFISYSILW